VGSFWVSVESADFVGGKPHGGQVPEFRHTCTVSRRCSRQRCRFPSQMQPQTQKQTLTWAQVETGRQASRVQAVRGSVRSSVSG
jgi:hypothetical protein